MSYVTFDPRRMTPQQIENAARSDPDAQPLTAEDLSRMQQIPRIKIVRRALKLTQEEFAARYAIPVGTLRDWEQGRTKPDLPASAYLKVIEHNPEGVRKIIKRATRRPKK